MRFTYVPGWNIVGDLDDWREYTEQWEQTRANEGHPFVRWGEAPTHFPALVSTYGKREQDGSIKALTAIAYTTHARLLLDAQHTMQATGEEVQDEACPATSSAEEAESLPVRGDFDRRVLAHLVTLVGLLTTRGMISETEYERALVANLAVVERWKAEDQDRIAKAVEGAGPVLGHSQE